MASSSSSSPAIPHDVFLSFRGEDVRIRFRSHFLKELKRKLITPFKDDEIEKGQSIAPELVNAIRGSRISVVAFSDNYASSSWCLDELAEIMTCREELGQIVIPIFYDVDPSHVKKQTHGFGKMFEETCEGRTDDEKLRWQRALTQAATIAGEDSRNWYVPNLSFLNGGREASLSIYLCLYSCGIIFVRTDEANMIEKIVNDVSNKLNFPASNDFDDLVGIEDHIKNMNSLLILESEEVIMVGIWGPSGVGKTTIGRALFNQLSCQFQGSVFIDKTKENYTTGNSDDYNTKLYLQTQFLSEILNQKDIKIHNLGAVKQRLGHLKVLVVFDDVDDQVLLKALVGRTTWFGPISRIVAISKDRELLRAFGVEPDRIYQVDFPSKELAFQMFCRCAFGQDSPPDGFMQLAIDAAELTGNLPLGLNVLGSSLAGMKKEEWADTVPKLRNRMTGQIDKTLRDSYDRLKEEDKAIFRHIACLFNHKPRDYVTRLLEDSKLDVHVGLVTLADRCLIQISKDDTIIRMHDFLQNMGRDIVRQPCIQDPGEREFLMDSKEICDVLVDGTGTKSVLGIFLNLSEIEDTFSISQKTFRRMKNLRFLSIYGVLRENIEVTLTLQGDEDHMWRQLRLLEWWGCPMRCMPPNFRPENLVELRMPDSHLEALWQGVQLLKSLKKMDLRRSKNLKEIPDLSKATNLEEMYLEDCWSLVMIPPSIGNLNRLRKLDMKRCINLQILPLNVDLESLHSLSFSGCSKLRSFPHISTKVSYLFLDETKIEEVPERIEDISELNYILMNGCSNLKYISPNISKLKHLEVIFFSNSDSLVKASAMATTTDNIHTQLPDASSSRKWEYDFFVSSHGTGVRRNFISHLYKQLYRKGLTEFWNYGNSRGGDGNGRGEDLSTEFVHGIRESRVAIVVLSDNYTSSRWCLDELVEIIKCSQEIGQKVVPIFYDVDPIRIKMQILDIGKTSETKSTVDKQQKWLQAFTVLTQIRGYHTGDWDNHAKMIGKLADDISFTVNIKTTEKISDVVGIEMLPRTRNNLEQEIDNALKWHYNMLNEKEKALFRHIACFLNNETYENVMRLLEDSDLDVGAGLKILYDLSLIQISAEDRVIRMLDLLQKLGRDIVLGPFIHQPAKRKFLMDTTEGCDVLIDQTGAENVFGISFKVSEMQERLRSDEKFKGMKKLQFMRMYKETLYDKEVKVHLVKGLHSLWERLSNI